MKTTRNENFVITIIKSMVGELAHAFVWFFVAFCFGTSVSAALCLYAGLPIILSPLGGLVIAAIVAAVFVSLRSSSVFDFWN